ncbi:MAG: aminopeptidase P family protein [Lachnospiraceae bacterium]|nr:aminopeptidase P family protein [Lachnospiraceae bacterium]
METAQKLEALRKAMEEAGVTAYYINTADFHNSEYVNDYFKVREFFTGFTGSAGELLVFKDSAYLWTDGRYFEQAEKEIAGSGIELLKSGQKGVETVWQLVERRLGSGDVFGFDGRTMNTAHGRRFRNLSKKKGFTINYRLDLSDGIFERPAFPVSTVEIIPDTLAGESVAEKLEKVRQEMKKMYVNALFITRLDDIMWLFNIRGNDIEYNPMLLSFAFITNGSAWIFLQRKAVNKEYEKKASKDGVTIGDYDDIRSYLKRSPYVCGNVLIDEKEVSYTLYRLIKKRVDKVIFDINPTQRLKAVKNPVEIENMKRLYIQDSLAVTRFIREMVTNPEKKTYTEISAQKYLNELRKAIPEYRDLSFATICAYGPNAAMMHYEASEDNRVEIENKGLLLVDSGAQYNGATTDITRTICMGELTKEEKEAYTLTAIGMLKLHNAIFLMGCTGRNLDILARERMWERGMDYKSGTGHGVGYILSVHEGPHAIRWRAGGKEEALKPGMVVTNEPGVYRAGKFGVRIENVMLVAQHEETADGDFLKFEPLTFAPIDDKGVDRSMMSTGELNQYLSYQKSVYDTLAPFLDQDEKDWLLQYAGIEA